MNTKVTLYYNSQHLDEVISDIDELIEDIDIQIAGLTAFLDCAQHLEEKPISPEFEELLTYILEDFSHCHGCIEAYKRHLKSMKFIATHSKDTEDFNV